MSAYVASLDVGTTTIRCNIINSSAQIVGASRSTVKLVYPCPGFVEIVPEQLWQQVLTVINTAIADAKLTANDIKSLGISTQRATFTTWKKDTGETFHNFITWKDMRAKELCKQINNSITFKSLRYAAYTLYFFTRIQRFLAGSNLKIAPNHVTARLLWIIQNTENLQKNLQGDNVLFGTLETWLLYKFTKGRLHVTDMSNASATGFFDPFTLEWGSWAKHFLGIPFKILPDVVANDFDFGSTSQDIFQSSIHIGCVMADQSSSMYASGCFTKDDIKITLGTGAFLNTNTATTPHPSATGIYPLIAWKLNEEVVCLAEAPCNDCGSLMEWLLTNVGMLDEPAASSKIAESVADNDGVYFIPAFSGLGPPINDVKAASGFLGIKPTSTQSHLVRSVLEAIAYRVTLAFLTLQSERKIKYAVNGVTVDGGVANNDFVCQLISDLTGLRLERLNTTDLSCWGVAFLAGLTIDLWDRSQVGGKFRKVERVFTPCEDPLKRRRLLNEFDQWLEVVKRFKSWYSDD